MRAALFALVAIGTFSAIDIAPAAAASGSYPFCMRSLYGDDDCTYRTYAQCTTTASGIGLTCFQNPALAYQSYGQSPAPRSRIRQYRAY